VRRRSLEAFQRLLERQPYRKPFKNESKSIRAVTLGMHKISRGGSPDGVRGS
jgi:hypothetical protein